MEINFYSERRICMKIISNSLKFSLANIIDLDMKEVNNVCYILFFTNKHNKFLIITIYLGFVLFSIPILLLNSNLKEKKMNSINFFLI